MTSEDPFGALEDVSRRGFLTRAAMLSGTLASGGILSACGSSNKGSGAGSATTSGQALSGDALGKKLRDLLGEPKNILSKGPGTMQVTGSWPLTGQGSIYGKLQTEGFRLGAEHIKAWTNGKLDFQIKALDHKSGDPAALVSNVRQAGNANEPIFITSYIFGFGAQTAPIKQFKMLSLDPGGGTGPLLKGVPYCYGFRSAYPTDLQPALYRAVKELYPDAKKVAAVDVQIAAPYNNAVKQVVQAAAQRNGLELVSFDLAPIGKTDYSSTLTKVKGNNPDAILFSNFGTDIGYLARGAQQQGIKAVFGAVDFTPDGAKIAGPAYKDWLFSQDYINAKQPTNDWTKVFVDACQAKFKDVQNYHAQYYAAAFAFAITLDRLLGQGGNIKNGDDWVKAFESDLTFPHVIGGSGGTLGKIVMDKKTHSPKSIPVIVLQADGTGSTSDYSVRATTNLGDNAPFQKV